MKVLLCDDEPASIKEMEMLLKEHFADSLQIYGCTGREELLKILKREDTFDILLMDICLEQDDGILAAKEILKDYPELSVVFVTGYPDLYYEKVFLEVRPYGFVKKPIDRELLTGLLEKIIREKKNPANWLFIKTKHEIKKIAVSDIYYIESHKHSVLVHMKDELYTTYGRISELAKELPEHFFHCHKSYLVNGEHIQSYEGSAFWLDNGVEIGISQSKRKEIRQNFFSYLGKN